MKFLKEAQTKEDCFSEDTDLVLEWNIHPAQLLTVAITLQSVGTTTP